MKRQQSGFTLIELIMVIVILGILSAFALPKFADLGGDARKASIQGAFGAIKSASAIVHAKALASSATSSVTLEGTSIDLVNGYPQALAATTAGILAAAQISASDYTLVTTNAGTSATANISVQATGATTIANCQITYTAAGSSSVPTIVLVSTGC